MLLKNLKEVYKFKELLYYFAWRDLRVRYKQTALGVVWVILQPLALIAIFVVFLSQIGRITDTGVPYALHMFSGLLYANYVTSLLNSISNSVVSNAALIKKIYFPRSVPGFAQVLVASVDFLVRIVLFMALFPIMGVDFHVEGLLILPFLVIITTAFALGLGFLFAALNVKYRDVGQALPLVNQIIFYLSPIIYALSIVPSNLQNILALNPLVGVIVAGRDMFFHGTIGSPKYLLASVVISFAALFIGLRYFFKEEPNFVDTV